MKIFIGSSRESLDLVHEMEVWLEEQGHEPLPWDQPGLFAPGHQTFQRLMTISRECEAAVFVFGEDDRVWYRGDTVPSPRDNILIEYGLFAGALGPEKAIVCRNGDPKHALDLAGLTYIDLSAARRARGKLELTIWARKLTTNTADPAVLQLQAKVVELEQRLSTTRERLEFETDKSKQLQDQLSSSKVIDFSAYDLTTTGHWKLLFEFAYFHESALLIARTIRRPATLKALFESAGATSVSTRISWSNPGSRQSVPDSNPDRVVFLARKALRLFRELPDHEIYRRFLDLAPEDVRRDASELAQRCLAKMKLEPPA